MEKSIKATTVFSEWLRGLKDLKARTAIASRVQRLKYGLYGDCEPVGNGISELRIHVSKGYRVYFKEQDRVITIVLCGGNKKTQAKDIKRAKQMAEELDL